MRRAWLGLAVFASSAAVLSVVAGVVVPLAVEHRSLRAENARLRAQVAFPFEVIHAIRLADDERGVLTCTFDPVTGVVRTGFRSGDWTVTWGDVVERKEGGH